MTERGATARGAARVEGPRSPLMLPAGAPARLAGAALLAIAVAAWALRPPPPMGWLGVTVADAPTDRGPAARLTTVLPEGPAARAALRAGDLVWVAAGRRVGGARDLTRTVRRRPPGSLLPLVVVRNGTELALAIPLDSRPTDLDRLLEVERDPWQEPDRVLDLLALAPGGVVADLGAGGGYFTERLAARVGAGGRVLAIDIDADALERLATRFPRSRFPQVSVQRGAPDDPRLAPASLDALLLVDAFHELEDAPAILAAVRRALRPGGRLVVVDRAAAEYEPAMHAIPERRVVAQAEAAGFRLRERQDLPRQFAVVFE